MFPTTYYYLTLAWRFFTDNEIGIILEHYQIQKYVYVRAKKNGTVFGFGDAAGNGRAAVVTTVVSSKMLKTIANREGVEYSETLTGFKWIGNECIRLQADGFKILFSYEEALGTTGLAYNCLALLSLAKFTDIKSWQSHQHAVNKSQ